MHELSVALSLLDLAADEARRHDGRVTTLHVKLGPLSGVVKEALLSAYELAREGSGLDGAALVIEDVPLVGRCPACDAERDVVSIQELCCSTCGTPVREIVRGRELELVALEIET